MSGWSGAGPGDPGYLTLHAVAALHDADVIVHDALIDARVLALAGPEARIEPAGKRGHQPSAEQDVISARLVELARQNLRVVRLKGGDPFMFGRAGEEMLALAEAGVPFRIVSGVTAGLAGPAAALIPPTLRGVNQAVIFATGHGAGDGPRIDWAALAATRQPLVVYMAMHQLAGIAADLIRGGLAPETPAAIVASATLPEERILVSRLDRIADGSASRRHRRTGRRRHRRGRHHARASARPDAGRSRTEPRDDRAGADDRGAGFRRGQDGAYRRAPPRAPPPWRASPCGQVRARLHRPGLPCRGVRR